MYATEIDERALRVSSTPRWGYYEDRVYDLDRFLDLFYGLASDEYGEALTKHELGLVFSDTLDVTGSSDCGWCGVDAWIGRPSSCARSSPMLRRRSSRQTQRTTIWIASSR